MDANAFLSKHGLPSIEELGEEINLSGLDDDKDTLKFITGKIGERLDHFTSLVENLVQPDNNFSNLHEYEAFSEEEKARVLKAYNKVMYMHRAYLEADLKRGDAEVDFIKEFWNSWQGLKQELAWIAGKMKDSWKSTNNIKAELGYLG